MKLIVISYHTSLKNEHETIIKMMEKGLMHFHLRKPDFSISDIRNYLKKIPSELHHRIILHSHYSLLNEFEFGGIHFTGKTIHQLNKWNLPDGKTKSASCHSFSEAENYGNNTDYLFISPVFNSISKHGYNSNFTFEELKAFLKNWKNKAELTALGGICHDNIHTIKSIDFNACAVLGYIWEPLKNRNKTLALKSFEKLYKKVEETN